MREPLLDIPRVDDKAQAAHSLLEVSLLDKGGEFVRGEGAARIAVQMLVMGGFEAVIESGAAPSRRGSMLGRYADGVKQ